MREALRMSDRRRPRKPLKVTAAMMKQAWKGGVGGASTMDPYALTLGLFAAALSFVGCASTQSPSARGADKELQAVAAQQD